jgi:hypothetical protein
MRRVWAVAGLGVCALVGAGLSLTNCAGNGASELPPEPLAEAVPSEGPVEAPAVADEPAAPAEPSPADATPAAPPPSRGAGDVVRPPLAPLAASVFTPLELQGTRGGSLAYEIEGDPLAVAAMLLDFEGANGVRPWAQRYRTVSTTGDVTRAEWHFRGKMGVNPQVEIEFVRQALPDGGVRIRYKLVRKAFGIAAWFGDWRVRPVRGVAGRSRLTARVYVDSGLPFVGASSQDIEDGLREDAAAMRGWMERRLGAEDARR